MDKCEYIARFDVCKMWGRVNVNWDNIHKDVNILVGINGCGKTTLLNLMYDYYNPSGQKSRKNTVAESMSGTDITSPVTYIRSFDVPANVKKKSESMLLQELKYKFYQNGEGTSFFDYRMKMVNYPELTEKINARIDTFFKLVNSIFSETGKEMMIDRNNNNLVFSINESHQKIQLDQLSSGEKQILLILMTVFLQEEEPNVLLMDEPEISLHITWQDKLLGMMRELNPNCQLILTTHSPNIFADGWEDKIVFMQDLLR
ncbi:MAG: ATP-binding protein [Staphylococcus sp.]|nr:ATP-binding protein [Staphylococcus sp.]